MIPIARYRFTAIAQAPLHLPSYAGSMLRGQFGAALRQAACMTRAPTCPGCPLLQTCPYARLFEAPAPPKGSHALQDFSQIPNPYVIEPPDPPVGQATTERHIPAHAALTFSVVLIGHATQQLALVVYALQRALAHGLGKDRVPLQLESVEWLDGQHPPQSVWHTQNPTLAGHSATLALPPPPNACTALTLQLHTPLRLQSQGQPLREAQLTPRALISALARRAALLMDFHAPGTPPPVGHATWGDAARCAAHEASALRDKRELHWFDWTRYSSRQRQEMTLGGVLGRWTLEGEADTLSHLHHWLWLGQWLHVGKNATMGLGGYTLSAQPRH